MMDCAVLMEDNLHGLGGTYGWDPLWRGALAIYGEEENHCIHVLDYYFVYGLFRLLAFFNCLVEIVVLFSKSVVLHSTRVFSVGNPYLILKKEEVLELHFLIPAFGQSYLL